MLKVRCSVSLAARLRDAKPYYQAEGEWHNAVDILLEAISKDRERVEKMNERLEKVRFMVWVLPYGERLIVSFRSLRRSILLRRRSSLPSLSNHRLLVLARPRVRCFLEYSSPHITYPLL